MNDFDIAVPHERIRVCLHSGWDVAVVGDSIVCSHQNFPGQLLAVHIRFNVFPAFTSHFVFPITQTPFKQGDWERDAMKAELAEAVACIESVLNPEPVRMTPDEEDQMARDQWESERTLREAETLGPDGWRIKYQSYPSDPREDGESFYF